MPIESVVTSLPEYDTKFSIYRPFNRFERYMKEKLVFNFEPCEIIIKMLNCVLVRLLFYNLIHDVLMTSLC